MLSGSTEVLFTKYIYFRLGCGILLSPLLLFKNIFCIVNINRNIALYKYGTYKNRYFYRKAK
jgi:hypothetical protein